MNTRSSCISFAMAPRWGFPGLYSSSEDISSTSLWIGLSKVDKGRLLFPFDARFRLPTSSFTFLTSPSSSGSASTTRHTLHWFLGTSSCLTIATSFTWRFFLGLVHFCRSCKERRNSFFHRIQNSFVRCCTRVHHFLE